MVDNTVTIVGNLTADPEVRVTDSGATLAEIRIAQNKRKRNSDGSWEGSVVEQGVWQKRKLAYQIETFNEGIYTITSFEGPANLPSELDRVLKISDDVIRHKVLKMES